MSEDRAVAIDPRRLPNLDDFLRDAAEGHAKKVLEMDQEAQRRDAILKALEELGKIAVGEDGLTFEGEKFVIPAQYAGRIGDAIKFLKQHDEQQNKTYSFSRTFKYRPWDGAAAFQRALKKMFNHTGLGMDTMTFFGPRPPQFRSIEVDVNETQQVPWGEVKVPQLEAEFNLGATGDEDYGILFALAVEAPRRYRAHLEAFFDIVEEELRTGSLYRGKAINGAEFPGFLDLSTVDPGKVVYSQEVYTQLGANFWTLIERAPLMRELGIPLKRSILVSGPYGSGKTLAGYLSAQRAIDHGWTFILCRPGKDNLLEVLNTAKLYSPAVVWFEDIDTVASGGDSKHISQVLDALDSISNKGTEVLAGFTTNHIEKIQKGVLRPGRIDSVIEIGSLDVAGIEKLVKVNVPGHLLSEDIDYQKVAQAFEGFMPAFYREAIDRSLRYMIDRTGGTDMITTDDLVNAANGLRPQHELMTGANEKPDKPTIDSVLGDKVTETLVNQVHMMDDGGPGFGFVEKKQK